MSDTRMYAIYLIQGQGHGGLKRAKVADFRGYLLRQYACNQKNGKLWYSSQHLDRFLIFILVRHHVIFKLSVPPLANEESTSSPIPGLFI